MSRGKRYNAEKQLNIKKVLGLVLTIILIILFVIGIKKILNADKTALTSKNIELAYYPVFTNGNWGVINSSGEYIIEPAYAEMIMVPNKSKPVFICTYEVNYVESTYKTKAINERNEELFTEYESINTLQNYDENNNLWYEENALKVQQNGKYGLINLNGNVLLNCEYDSISTLKGITNSILIKKDGKIGLVNSSGTIIAPAQYSDVSALTNNYLNGYIVKNAEGKFGVISSDGNIILECIYDDIKHTTDNEMYIVKSSGTWKVILKDGTSYLEGKVDGATGINSGNVIVKSGANYGVYSIEANLKIPTEYENIIHAYDDKYIAKKNGKYGVITINNEIVIDFNYENIEYNKTTDYLKAQKSEGVYDYITRNLEVKLTAGNETILDGCISVEIQNETKYYNYQLEEKTNKDAYSSNTLFVIKQNGKYGFTDKNGNIVVECIYEDATEQNEYGYSAIKANGKWGAIDQQGKIVVSPMYTIDNEKPINFISKWHISADDNANYYTDLNE